MADAYCSDFNDGAVETVSDLQLSPVGSGPLFQMRVVVSALQPDPSDDSTGEVRGALAIRSEGFMNFRNRYLVITIRMLLGLIMLASGISGLLMGNSTQGVPEQMVAFTQVFWASGIFQMVKVTEITAGFMLVFGIFPALATLFLAPDVVGIVIVNARLMPSFLWLGAIVFVLAAYLGYAYWDKYKSLFTRG